MSVRPSVRWEFDTIDADFQIINNPTQTGTVRPLSPGDSYRRQQNGWMCLCMLRTAQDVTRAAKEADVARDFLKQTHRHHVHFCISVPYTTYGSLNSVFYESGEYENV